MISSFLGFDPNAFASGLDPNNWQINQPNAPVGQQPAPPVDSPFVPGDPGMDVDAAAINPETSPGPQGSMGAFANNFGGMMAPGPDGKPSQASMDMFGPKGLGGALGKAMAGPPGSPGGAKPAPPSGGGGGAQQTPAAQNSSQAISSLMGQPAGGSPSAAAGLPGGGAPAGGKPPVAGMGGGGKAAGGGGIFQPISPFARG